MSKDLVDDMMHNLHLSMNVVQKQLDRIVLDRDLDAKVVDERLKNLEWTPGKFCLLA